MVVEDLNEKLPQEDFINCSGEILNEGKIEVLKESLYYIKPRFLDGDAPKYFIRAYFYERQSGVRKKNLKTWTPFIAKSAEKWYPHESVIEFMINRIGQEMGLNMNEVRLTKINGQIRFLSKFFKGKSDRLIHGAEICGEYLDDPKFAKQIAVDRQSARDLFTFEFICEAIESVFPDHYDQIIEDLVKMIAFDAISGNNDRHFYNWGVLDSAVKKQKKPKFAPIYDSARGFVWNWSDSDIIKHWENRQNGGTKIDKYINQAAPRISCEENKAANHFELIQYLKKKDGKFKKIINDLAAESVENTVVSMLKSEFFSYFIRERNLVIEYIVRTRFEKVRSL